MPEKTWIPSTEELRQALFQDTLYALEEKNSQLAASFTYEVFTTILDRIKTIIEGQIGREIILLDIDEYLDQNDQPLFGSIFCETEYIVAVLGILCTYDYAMRNVDHQGGGRSFILNRELYDVIDLPY